MTTSDSPGPRDRYQRFWQHVGDTFPDLGGAASTAYYRANEERLFTRYLPPLRGLRILKTDLWDEARNTRILLWAARQGAEIHGVDISEPTTRMARAEAAGLRPRFSVADCRQVPYRDNTFDAIYSMGTIEHFDESDTAVREMWRVLKPGGRAIVGVPNRHDPFLRPLLVAALSAAGLYDYGFEKSYSKRALRELMTSSGFDVMAESSILFIPGAIRMLDLACHAWLPALTPLTAAMVWPFAVLERRLPLLQRHGYLIAAVGRKPVVDQN